MVEDAMSLMYYFYIQTNMGWWQKGRLKHSEVLRRNLKAFAKISGHFRLYESHLPFLRGANRGPEGPESKTVQAVSLLGQKLVRDKPEIGWGVPQDTAILWGEETGQKWQIFQLGCIAIFQVPTLSLH